MHFFPCISYVTVRKTESFWCFIHDSRHFGVSRFGLRVRLVSRGTSVRIRSGSPFSWKLVVCGRCLATLFLTLVYDILPSTKVPESSARSVGKPVPVDSPHVPVGSPHVPVGSPHVPEGSPHVSVQAITMPVQAKYGHVHRVSRSFSLCSR